MKKLIALLFVVALCSTTVGCGKGDTKPTGSSTAPTATTPAKDTSKT